MLQMNITLLRVTSRRAELSLTRMKIVRSFLSNHFVIVLFCIYTLNCIAFRSRLPNGETISVVWIKIGSIHV